MSLADPAPSLANVEAEAALLGALMLDNRLIPVAVDRLGVDDFAEQMHGRIFKTIARLAERGMSANPVTLRPFLEADPAIVAVGGAGYLAQLTGSGAALIGAQDFIEQVAELAARRRAREVLIGGIDRLQQDLDDPIADVLSALDGDLWNTTAAADPVKPSPVAAMVRKTLERNQRIITSERAVGARCLFVPEMDRVLGPLEPGYHIIGARPGMGKSTLAQSTILGYGANGHAGEYFSWEMTDEQLGMRVTSDLCHWLGHPVEHKRLLEGNLTSAELQAVEHAATVAEQLPVDFTSVTGADVRKLDSMIARAKVKWARRGKKLEVVVVDYLQLIGASSNGRPITDKFARVSAVSRGLAEIWKKHEVAIIALAQVSRQVEDRKDKRPQLNDLKDAGEIEQDADTVTFVYRDEVYLLREQPPKKAEINDQLRQAWEADLEIARGKAEVIGGKNRHRKPQTRTVKFLGEHFAMRSEVFSETARIDDIGFDFDGGGQ